VRKHQLLTDISYWSWKICTQSSDRTDWPAKWQRNQNVARHASNKWLKMYQPKDFRRKILKLLASAYTHNQNLSWMKDKKLKLLVQMTYIYFNTILHMSQCYRSVYTWTHEYTAHFPLLGSENLKVFSLGNICMRSLQSLQSTTPTITHN